VIFLTSRVHIAGTMKVPRIVSYSLIAVLISFFSFWISDSFGVKEFDLWKDM
jgi:hypothetical protein